MSTLGNGGRARKGLETHVGAQKEEVKQKVRYQNRGIEGSFQKTQEMSIDSHVIERSCRMRAEGKLTLFPPVTT